MAVSWEMFECVTVDRADRSDSMLAQEKPLIILCPAIAAKYVESLMFAEFFIGDCCESMCGEHLAIGIKRRLTIRNGRGARIGEQFTCAIL